MLRFIKLLILFLIISQNQFGQQNLSVKIEKLLVPYYKNNEPGGVVLVAKNGGVVYKKAFGMANLELEVPVNDSMIFYIGSNTKQFTAVALLQLAEQGKIKLQDSLGQYIPSCPSPVSGITIKQLLTHTSGLGSNSETDNYRLLISKKFTPLELVNYFINLPLDFPPGSKWSYNNANYYAIGYLIEKLSGLPLAKYLEENIFKPAGMFNTYMDKEILIIKNRPSGYTNFRLGIQNTLITNVATLYASGGIQSTAGDMLKWNRALKAGTLLKHETLQLAYQPQTLSNDKLTTYGMGWHLQEVHGSTAFRHGGLVEGFTSETIYLPQEDAYVVMLLNQETSKIPIVALVRMIAALAIDKPYNFDEVSINKSDLKKFIGLYENNMQELVNINEQNGRLTFQRPNGRRYDLHYAGNNEFFFENDYLRTEFTRDSAGHIKSLQFSSVDIGMTEWFKTQKPLLKLSPERIADSLLKSYAGKYLSDNNDTLGITRDGVTLYLLTGKGAKHTLVAEGNRQFFSIKENIRVEFVNEPGTNSPGLLFINGSIRKMYLKL